MVDPLARRPRIRAVRRIGWALFGCGMGVVLLYVAFATLLAFRKPTIRASGAELWRSAMRFDASQAPVYPQYIDALWLDRPTCGDCPQNWLDEKITPPSTLAKEAREIGADDEGFDTIAPETRASWMTRAIDARQPDESGWRIGEWFLAESESRLASIRALATQKPFGFVPALSFDQRTARFFGVSSEVSASWLTSTSPQSNSSQSDTPLRERENVDPWADAMYTYKMPESLVLRQLVPWFLLDARHAAYRGDGRRAVEDLAAAMGIADQLDENPSALAQISAATMRKWTWSEARDIVAKWPQSMDDALLAQLETVVLSVGDGPLPLNLDGLRSNLKDALQRGFTESGSLRGRVDGRALSGSALVALDPSYGMFGRPIEGDRVITFFAGPFLWAVMPSRAEVDEMFTTCIDQLEAELKLHPADRKPVVVPPVSLLDPGPGIVARHVDLHRQTTHRLSTYARERDRARVVIAAERFRRAEGRSPRVIDELVPTYLREIPRDVDTGLPLTRLDGRDEIDEVEAEDAADKGD